MLASYAINIICLALVGLVPPPEILKTKDNIMDYNEIYEELLGRIDIHKWINSRKSIMPRKDKKRLFGTRRARKRIYIFIRDNRKILWRHLVNAGIN